MTSQPMSFRSINVSVNGVVKNVIIPCDSFASSSTTIVARSSQSLPLPFPGNVNKTTRPASQSVTVSSSSRSESNSRAFILPRTVPLASAKSSSPQEGKYVVSASASPLKMTSLLTSVRFPAAAPSGQKLIVTAETVSRTTPPAIQVQMGRIPPRIVGQGQKVSLIGPAMGVRGSAPNVLTVASKSPDAMSSQPKVRYILQPVTRPAVSTPLKTVTIRRQLSPNEVGSQPGYGPASERPKVQYKLLPMQNTVRGAVPRIVKVFPVPKLNKSDVEDEKFALKKEEQQEEEPEEKLQELHSQHPFKVIEIIPDGEEDEEEGNATKENDEFEKAEVKVRDQKGEGGFEMDQDLSSDSQGSRLGIFETLNSMSWEDANRAASAVVTLSPPPSAESQDSVPLIDSLVNDPKMNIVHLGDDHVVVENIGYDDDDDDDEGNDSDDEETISADEMETEPQLLISEPYSLALNPTDELAAFIPSPERLPTEAAGPGYLGSAESQLDQSGEARRNVAKRTGGRPHLEAARNVARRTGGKPMKPIDRYGVDLKDCFVSLEMLFMRRNFVKSVSRQLHQILCCRDGRVGVQVRRLWHKNTMKRRSEAAFVPEETRSTGKRIPKKRLIFMPDPCTKRARKGKQWSKIPTTKQRKSSCDSMSVVDAKHRSEKSEKGEASKAAQRAFQVTGRKRKASNLDDVIYQGTERLDDAGTAAWVNSASGSVELKGLLTASDTNAQKRQPQPRLSKAASSYIDVRPISIQPDTPPAGPRSSSAAAPGREQQKFLQFSSTPQVVRQKLVTSAVVSQSEVSQSSSGKHTTTLAQNKSQQRIVAVAPGSNYPLLYRKSARPVPAPGPPSSTTTTSPPTPGRKKFLLIKTSDGSFLVPVGARDTNAHKIPVQMTHAVEMQQPSASSPSRTVITVVRPGGSKASPVKSPVGEAASAPPTSGDGEGQSPVAQDGHGSSPTTSEQDADYESAAAGMRKQDRISHLKELLRLQKEKLEAVKRKKDQEQDSEMSE